MSHPTGSFEDAVLQETFTRERNARVSFARLIVNALMATSRVFASDTLKGRYEIIQKNEAELARLVDVYEAEVHQDLYRHDVIAAINERLTRRLKENDFAAKYDEAMQAKVTAFGED